MADIFCRAILRRGSLWPGSAGGRTSHVPLSAFEYRWSIAGIRPGPHAVVDRPVFPPWVRRESQSLEWVSIGENNFIGHCVEQLQKTSQRPIVSTVSSAKRCRSSQAAGVYRPLNAQRLPCGCLHSDKHCCQLVAHVLQRTRDDFDTTIFSTVHDKASTTVPIPSGIWSSNEDGASPLGNFDCHGRERANVVSYRVAGTAVKLSSHHVYLHPSLSASLGVPLPTSAENCVR